MDIVVSNHKRHCLSIIITGAISFDKSVVGSLLAQRLGYVFEDADQFHAAANKLLRGWWQTGTSGVLVCSALKERYHEILSGGSYIKTLQFVHLTALELPPEQIVKHILERLLF